MSKETTESTECLEWFTKDYLIKILSTYENNPIEIINWTKSLGSSKGENFASSLHRVKATYRIIPNTDIKHISTMVKSQLDDDFMVEIDNNFNTFERESQMYTRIIMKIENLLRQIGDNTVFGPRALYTDNRVIVLEDLKDKGYGLLDVKTGLNYEQCQRVLEKLAKFHATTRILFEKEPDLFKYHMQGNISEVKNPLHDMYINTSFTCVEYVKTRPELMQYSKKLEEFRKNIVQKMRKTFTRDDNGFNTLNHGDIWVNNLMFKQDSDGNIQDMLFVDYQEGYFGSPGIDFNYFFNTSLQKDIYSNRQNDLIKYYHTILEDTFEKFKHKTVSLDDIKNEIASKKYHGLVTVTSLYPVLSTDRKDLCDPINFLFDGEEHRENRLKVFDHSRYREVLKIALPEYIKDGVL